jgi:hypothetical protein
MQGNSFDCPKPTPSMQGVDIAKLIEERRTFGYERIAGGRTPMKRAKSGAGGGVAPPTAVPAAPAAEVDGGAAFAAALIQAGAAAAAVTPHSVVGGLGVTDARGEGAGTAAPSPPLKTEEGESEAAPAAGVPGKVAAAKKHHRQQQQQGQQGQQQMKVEEGGPGGEMRPPPDASRPRAAAVDGVGGGAGDMLSTPVVPGGGVVGMKSPASAAAAGGEGGGAASLAVAEMHQTGYHAKRNEFEPEYDHEAELIISELDFRCVYGAKGGGPRGGGA